MIIQKLLNKKEDLRVLIVVPTDALKEQWSSILDSLGLGLNCQVIVINTVINNQYQCDLLVMDEKFVHVKSA